jgi:hypothetical protein
VVGVVAVGIGNHLVVVAVVPGCCPCTRKLEDVPETTRWVLVVDFVVESVVVVALFVGSVSSVDYLDVADDYFEFAAVADDVAVVAGRATMMMMMFRRKFSSNPPILAGWPLPWCWWWMAVMNPAKCCCCCSWCCC